MIGTLVALTGGIGLFLLGMILLTDGLKALGGEALRQALVAPLLLSRSRRILGCSHSRQNTNRDKPSDS